MLTVDFLTPHDYLLQISKKAKAKRLSLNLTQNSLAIRSGVSLGTIKRFERTGQISLESLLKLSLVLESLDSFSGLFKPPPIETLPSLDFILKQKERKRGRK